MGRGKGIVGLERVDVGVEDQLDGVGCVWVVGCGVSLTSVWSVQQPNPGQNIQHPPPPHPPPPSQLILFTLPKVKSPAPHYIVAPNPILISNTLCYWAAPHTDSTKLTRLISEFNLFVICGLNEFCNFYFVIFYKSSKFLPHSVLKDAFLT